MSAKRHDHWGDHPDRTWRAPAQEPGFQVSPPGSVYFQTLASTMTRRSSVARLSLQGVGDQVVVQNGGLLEVTGPL